MSALVSSELLKLRTTRTAFGFLVATVLLTVGIGAATFATITVTGKEDLEDALAGRGIRGRAAAGAWHRGRHRRVPPRNDHLLAARVTGEDALPVGQGARLSAHRCRARPGGHARDLCAGRALAVGPGRTHRAPGLLRLRGAGGAGRGARRTLRSARRGRGHADPQPDRRGGGGARLPVHTRPRAVAGVRGCGQVHARAAPSAAWAATRRTTCSTRSRRAWCWWDGPSSSGWPPSWWTVGATCSRRARRPRDRARRRRAPPARAPRRATPRSGPARAGTRSRDPCCPGAPPPLARAGSRRCPGRA